MKFTRTEYERFVADESPAIEQLRLLAGGQLREALDGSLESLAKVDRFVENLRAMSGWPSPKSLSDVSPDMRSWLAVRVAYYLASVLREHFGFQWNLVTEEGSRLHEQPALVLKETRFSPVEIGVAHVSGDLDGGLERLVSDIGKRLHLG